MTTLDPTKIKTDQIAPTKEGYESLYEQIEFGRFNSSKSSAAPTLYEEFVAKEDEEVFQLKFSHYTVGDHSLQVFVNGQYMRIGADNDYTEVDNKTIQFNFGLEEGDVIVMRVAGGTSGPSLHENYRAKENQTSFPLSTAYITGNDSLIVFVNGAYQTKGIDYLETNSNTVTFTEPLELDDLVTFRVEGPPTSQAKYTDQYTSYLYDRNNQLIKEEEIGDGVHIIKEYYYDGEGKPEKMVIRDGGYVIERTYTWVGFRCTRVDEKVRGMA